jgi:hypothetical protein
MGRELVAFGIETVKAIEVILDEFNRLGYTSEAGLQDLIAAAYLNDVPLDFQRPAYVKGTITGEGGRKVAGICGPYSFYVNLSNNYYYTHNFVDLSASNTLYQGTVKQSYSGTAPIMRFWKDVPGQFQSVPWFTYREYAAPDGGNSSVYVKLGLHAMSASVRVFGKIPKYPGGTTKQVAPLALYDGYNGGPDEWTYKVMPGHDGSVNVYFGDGVWGKPYDPATLYHIYWIERTYNNVNLDDVSLLNPTVAGDDPGAYPDNNPAPFNKLKFEIQSIDNSPGKDIDITYASAYLKGQLAQLRGLGSLQQVREFCKSIPDVLDAYVIAAANTLRVYIKPRYAYDAVFDHIYDWLIQKGVGGMTYSVERGRPLSFTVNVRLFGDLTGLVQSDAISNIKSELEKRYAYDVTPFRDVVSILEVQQIIQSVLPNLTALVSLSIKENLYSYDGMLRTSILPVRNTIKVRDGNGNVTHADYEGVLYQYDSVVGITADFNTRYRVGDSLITGSDFINPILSEHLSGVIHSLLDNVTITSDTVMYTTQSQYNALLVVKNPNGATAETGDHSTVFMVPSPTLGETEGSIYASLSKSFTATQVKDVDLATWPTYLWPAAGINIGIRPSGVTAALVLLYNSSFVPIFSLATLQGDFSQAVTHTMDKSNPVNKLTLAQSGDDVFVFRARGASVPAVYIIRNISVSPAASEVTLDGSPPSGDYLYAGPEYIFSISGSTNQTRVTAWRWSYEDSGTNSKMKFTTISGTINIPVNIANMIEAFINHTGDILVVQFKGPGGTPGNTPFYTVTLTPNPDNPAQPIPVLRTVYDGQTPNISVKARVYVGAVDYNTGIIATGLKRLDNVSYDASNIAMLPESPVYPIMNKDNIKVTFGL